MKKLFAVLFLGSFAYGVAFSEDAPAAPEAEATEKPASTATVIPAPERLAPIDDDDYSPKAVALVKPKPANVAVPAVKPPPAKPRQRLRSSKGK